MASMGGSRAVTVNGEPHPAPSAGVETSAAAATYDETARPSRLDVGLLGLALLLAGAAMFGVRRFITDDAFISMRYARQLAEGNGPVWNAGGPPVEGASNPLVVLLEAAVFRAGGDGVLLARGLGVAAALTLVVAVWWLARPVVGVRAANVAALMIAGTPALAYWAVGGLETLPVALVVTVCSLLLARADGGPAPTVGALLALMPWLRPEGMVVVVALVVAGELPRLLRRSDRARTLRRLAWLVGLPLLSQLALQALRYAWYEHLVPNSVVYKTGTAPVGVVTQKFFLENTAVVLLAALALILLHGRARILAAVPATYLLASLTFADSVNTFSRLLLPILPLLLVLAAAALPGLHWLRVGPRDGRAVYVVSAAAVVLVPLLVGPIDIRTARSAAATYDRCKDAARREVGTWLRDRTPPGTTFAIADAGLTPYLAERTALDLFGLNDPQLQETGVQPARPRVNRILAAQPEVLVLSSRRSPAFQPIYGVDKTVAKHPVFLSDYVPVLATAPQQGCRYFLHTFARRGALTS